MSDWNIAKLAYLHMPVEEKRQLYRCGENFKKIGDIVDWGTYAQTDAAKKLGVSSITDGEIPKKDELNKKISVFTGDITCLEIDAIVNAANNLLAGGGGVDGAIHAAADRSLLQGECRMLECCETGSAKITGGYKLPAKYVIHAVGPMAEDSELLSNCYKTSLDLLKENELETIAFPCISTGIYGYPNDLGELQEGTLKDNGLMDESKIILIPNVETGLLAQRPENTVMQALESLNDSQVNDFLSGKTPLNLSMRLGDHMMLIQLQLSTVNPSSPSHAARTKSSIKSKISSAQSSHPSTTISHTETVVTTESIQRSRSNSIDLGDSNTTISTATGDVAPICKGTPTTPTTFTTATPESSTNARQRDLILTSRQFEDLKSIVNSLSNMQQQQQQQQSNDDSSFENDSLLEQSPIKSLSNLVSSPIKTIPIKSIPIADFATASTSNATDPITAKLTSCLCKRLDSNSNSNECDSNCQVHSSARDQPQTSPSSLEHNYSSSASTSSSSTSSALKSLRSALLHRTTNNPIVKSKHRQFTNAYLRRSKSSDNIRSSEAIPSTSTSGQSNFLAEANPTDGTVNGLSGGDTRALAEASRNLTQTLRKLSKEIFTNKVDVAEENQRKNANGCGAVIESMKNHGKGIYSGTFSGTLNPALQDRFGRPKRDISTVIHILNDLLSATPQYSRGARINFEPTTTRAIKQAPIRTQTFQKDTICTKCSTTRSLNCIYGECNGHSTDYYCDKHRPINEPTTTIQMPSSCRCARILKLDESSNDSLNSSDCQCQFRSFDTTAPEEGTSNSSITELQYVQSAKQSIKCSSIEQENSKTKSKLDQLRLVMRQKKERREARKLKSSPYGDSRMIVPLGGSSNSLLNNSSTITSSITSPNDLVEQQHQQQQHQEQQQKEVDTAA